MADEPLTFKHGKIGDVVLRPLAKHLDERGWLSELFRIDELEGIPAPAMAYVSMTAPGVARGPHEHEAQTDYFCFVGPSNFKIYLWDSRPGSDTYGIRQVVYAGADSPKTVVVPPGVVHAYKNVGTESGLVFNAPDRLYAGQGRKHPVDEIRHEDAQDSPFVLD